MPRREFRGVRVRNLRSSVESTLLGLNGISPAPLNPPRILLSIIVALNVAWKVGKKSSLVIWII